MVQEVTSDEEFRRLTEQKGKLVVVYFTATRCTPCKRISPAFEQLAAQHSEVLFLKVVEDNSKEMMMSLSVKGYPTFRFYMDGSQVDEAFGVTIHEVASMVEKYKAKMAPSFGGQGVSLGGSGATSAEPLSAEDARARRLARFGNQVTVGSGAKPDPEVARRNAKILAADSASNTPPAPTAESGETPPVATMMDVDPPGVPGVSGSLGGLPRKRRNPEPSLVSVLTDMGFSETRCKKALMFGDGEELDDAINWIMAHQEDSDIDEPIPEGLEAAPTAAGAGGSGSGDQMKVGAEEGDSGGAASAQSLKCDECGATLKDVTAAELHAHKTGHSDFSESTDQVKALTPEEKAAKVAKMKELIAARRLARGEEEKVDHVKREKARRTMGKEAAKTKEEMQAIARKNEIARIRKEKDSFERERTRLREEIARDKAERKARGGKLSTKLGVDGYNPSAPQGTYGGEGGDGGDGNSTAMATVAAAASSTVAVEEKKAELSEEKMKKAITMLSRQTVAGVGATAMKTCLAYIRNALNKPEEEKFRSINLSNNAYKNRVSTCIGGVSLLKAVGFVKEADRLYMSMEMRDEALLTQAKEALEAAIASYVPSKAL